ncbi:alpha-galactosidase [Streptosporangium pseudovulgare]|uniref:Alpha-galactosidase n=1 Tax=Streptosporangium pseudovulgare TaxID=35765 RepID=A0ABQ2R9F1_9ACTN|nr:alpha-galactosidase [Streptosporangium pseudovulgare]GGQ14386.1 alpha-galactosidase [Streptosporangium pseudovulgare]
MITYEEPGSWLLTTPSSAYVVRLGPDGAPRCAHWGPRLTPGQARALPAGREELPGEGGERFGVAGLQVRYGDAVRGVEWRHLGHDTDTDTDTGTAGGGDGDGEGAAAHLVIRMADRHYPLEIDLHYRVRSGSDAIDRWTTLRNTGDEPITIPRCDSAAWTVPQREDYRLTHVTGGWGAEFQVRRTALATAETVLTSRRGHSGHHANPWVMLDAGDATEDHGEVWSAALAWSGSWRITVERDHDGRAGWSGGFGHEGVTWRLGPGEALETPAFTGVYSAQGFGGISHRWHDHVRRHVLPAPRRVRPVVFNSWEATQFDISQAQQMELAELAAGIGVELFVMDDGWFGGRTGETAGLGDWWPNPERFPDGLTPLVEHVKRLGMQFGLWVEPESVNPDSELYRTRPEWVLRQPNRHSTEVRNQLLLDFSRDDVADWAYDRLDELVTGDDVAFLKWDMNRPVTEAGDEVWVPYIRNVYAVIDRLRAAHPHLMIEGCASGGGRADLGMIARTDQIWTSDNTDAAQRIAIQHGYGQMYPACTMGAWVTDSPNAITGGRTPLAFRFHVAMAGALGIGGDLRRWSPEDLEEARHLVARYKEIRPVVHGGRLDRLADWAVQYTLDADVVVLSWRPTTLVRATAPLRLKGLDPDGRYRDEDTGEIRHGALLMSHGLPRPWPFEGVSELKRFTRVG